MLSEAEYGFRGPGGGNCYGASCGSSNYHHPQQGTATSPTAVPDLPVVQMRSSSNDGLQLPGPMVATQQPASSTPPAVVPVETSRSSSAPTATTASAAPAPPPTTADTQSSTGGTLPSRGSQVNLEEMIGSSLAFAINSLDHTANQPLSSWGSTDSSSGGTVSPVDSARSPSLDEPDPMATYQLYQQMLAQQAVQQMAAQVAGNNNGDMGGVGKQPSPRIRIPVVQGLGPHAMPPHPYAPSSAQHTPHSISPMMSPPNYVPSGPMPVVGAEDMMKPPTPPGFASSSPRTVTPMTPNMPNMTPNTGGSASANSTRSTLFETSTGIEMVQFLLETESRALMIFNVEAVPSELLLIACEKLGSLAYLRTEFRASRGVAFVAYHDLRAAIRCHHTLARELAAMGLSQEQRPAIAHYSIMLNAANTPRDGILLVRDLQASSVTESDVQAVFSSYGQLKNVHRRMLASAGGAVIFMVEYYDLQDAKLAVYELSASTPWGHGVRVEEAERPDKERQLGQQLLLTLHRWRAEQRATFPRISTFMPNMEDAEDPGFATSPQSAGSNLSPPQLMYFKAASYPGPAAPGSNGSTPTLMAYPGSSPYSAQHAAYAQLMESSISPLDETGLCGGFKGLWVSPHGLPSPGGKNAGRSPPLGAHYPRRTARQRDGMVAAAAMMGGGTPMGGCGGTDMEYQLDVDKVHKGLDKRTTIMIRNIPNKYTQALLLSEINVCHKGKYDFFYLPIDFKNKCNVGYAFINFIDYRAIVPFFKEFNGQRWKNFNSEKVCAISYARIQGKQSMISRFQNSSLMEKDGEYRPLLFHSAGMERGRPEPFPMGNKHGRRSGNTTPTGCTNALLLSLGL